MFTRCSYLSHDFFILFYNHNGNIQWNHSTVGCDFRDSRFCTNLCLLINNGDASKNRRILRLWRTMSNHEQFLLWICCLCFQRQIRPTENPASLVTYSFNVILCFMWCPRNNLNNSSYFLLKQYLPIKSIQNNTKSGIIFPFYQSLNYNILFYFILSNSFHPFEQSTWTKTIQQTF